MTLAGGLDRSTAVLTANYNDFTDGSRSQFQDLDSRFGKGVQSEREERKHKVRHAIKNPNAKVNKKNKKKNSFKLKKKKNVKKKLIKKNYIIMKKKNLRVTPLY